MGGWDKSSVAQMAQVVLCPLACHVSTQCRFLCLKSVADQVRCLCLTRLARLDRALADTTTCRASPPMWPTSLRSFAASHREWTI